VPTGVKGITETQVDNLRHNQIEPALREGKWGRAAVTAADGLDTKPSPTRRVLCWSCLAASSSPWRLWCSDPDVIRRQVELVRKRIRRWFYGRRRPILTTSAPTRHIGADHEIHRRPMEILGGFR